jgi:CDP-glucose 4,6-dehydratase
MEEWQRTMEALVNSFWHNRKVLITGHTGFKGSWLALWLQRLGADTHGYSRSLPSQPSLFDAAGLSSTMQSTRGDICDIAALRRCMDAFAPEVVFHLAAQPIVRESYLDPAATYQTNVMGTLNVLECVRSCPSVRAVVVVTSDKCYENQEWPWPYRETDHLGGHDPYSSSKACAELVVRCYSNSFFRSAGGRQVAIATARAGNVLGGGDWAKDRLIPDTVRAFAAGETVRIRSPHAIRPWQHVLEALNGYLILAERLLLEGNSYSGPWNFGPATMDLKPVEWIVATLAGNWGEGARWECTPSDGVHEANILKIDWSKAAAGLGWKPALGLARSLEWVTQWYKGFYLGRNARDLCFEQLAAFSELATLEL